MHLWIFIEMCVYAMHPEVHRGSPLFIFRQTWAEETNLISHLWEQIIQRNLNNNNIRKPEHIWFGLYFNLYHFPFTCAVLMKTRDKEESKFNYKTIIWQITNMLIKSHTHLVVDNIPYAQKHSQTLYACQSFYSHCRQISTSPKDFGFSVFSSVGATGGAGGVDWTNTLGRIHHPCFRQLQTLCLSGKLLQHLLIHVPPFAEQAQFLWLKTWWLHVEAQHHAVCAGCTEDGATEVRHLSHREVIVRALNQDVMGKVLARLTIKVAFGESWVVEMNTDAVRYVKRLIRLNDAQAACNHSPFAL